jgi:vacuolar-type H+-ATPase subunit I/STV1
VIAAAKTYVAIGTLAVLLATNAYTAWQLSAERKAHQSFRLETSERVAAAERQRADQEAKNRQIEQELINAQEAHAAEVEAIREQRDAARVAGRVVADRVRDAARATAVLAGQVCADSAAAGVRATAATAAGMLADLRERADERAGILAQFATDAHLAGRACEREHDKARAALTAAP